MKKYIICFFSTLTHLTILVVALGGNIYMVYCHWSLVYELGFRKALDCIFITCNKFCCILMVVMVESSSYFLVVLQGENVVTAALTGPGIVFMQSMPFHRLSQRIARWCIVILHKVSVFVSSSLYFDLSDSLFFLQGGCISKHERQPKVLLSDSCFFLGSICGDFVILNLDWHMTKLVSFTLISYIEYMIS